MSRLLKTGYYLNNLVCTVQHGCGIKTLTPGYLFVQKISFAQQKHVEETKSHTSWKNYPSSHV